MKDYMFLYKGGDPEWAANSSPAEIEAIMGKWGAWMEELGKKGQLATGGSPLHYEGKRLNKKGVVTDISASELKELVSGYSIVKANSFEDAVKLAQSCPIFEHDGTTVEIREVHQI